MTKDELFGKYNIKPEHNQWDPMVDDWFSVEVYRLMHDGDLPPNDDLSMSWVLDFLVRAKINPGWIMKQDNWGSLWLTAKRMVARHFESILDEVNHEEVPW